MAKIRLRDVQVDPRRGNRLGRWFPSGSSDRGFIIDGFNLDIPHGQTTVILGPSGCGKSTLLRAIAGLLPLSSGRVFYDGRDVAGVPPGERMIGFLFQNYALYPHFNVRENITAYFRFKKQTPELGRLREETLRRTSALLDVDITYLLDRSPKGLSGGEKQRVALGRCITREPKLFLLDEPFSNLDAQLRSRYRLHLRTLLREFSITTVYVTHDQQEAMLLGDRIAIMNKYLDGGLARGYLEQTGTMQELYDRPQNMFVAGFLNLRPDLPAISFFDGASLDLGLQRMVVGIRPEHVRLATQADRAAVNARVCDVRLDALERQQVVKFDVGSNALPDEFALHTSPGSAGEFPAMQESKGGDEICGELSADVRIEAGDLVRLRFSKLHVFDRETGAARPIPAALSTYLDEANDQVLG